LYQEGGSNHGYIILPFVMRQPQFSGTILFDPTSNQLGKYKGKVHRNLITIKQGLDWSYQTEFIDGLNLFPNYVLHLGTLIKYGSVNTNG
jgi:hypothetical protein